MRIGGRMTPRELERRTRKFAIAVILFVESIRTMSVSRTLSIQLIRSATSIGANYREANRAESKKDFVHKIAIIEKEAAETQYWLELFENQLGRSGPAAIAPTRKW